MSFNPEMAESVREVLSLYRTLAIVGLSPQRHRASYLTARYMQAHGYRIVPVNPVAADAVGTILGERVHASLETAQAQLRAEGVQIEIVGCFRKAEEIDGLAEEAVNIGARCLWLPRGVTNHTACQRARHAGLEVVQDVCVKAEHTRLFGGPDWVGANLRAANTAHRRRQLPY